MINTLVWARDTAQDPRRTAEVLRLQGRAGSRANQVVVSPVFCGGRRYWVPGIEKRLPAEPAKAGGAGKSRVSEVSERMKALPADAVVLELN